MLRTIYTTCVLSMPLLLSTGGCQTPDRTTFPFGQEHAGLASRAWVKTHTFSTNGALVVLYAKKNVGQTRLYIWDSGFSPNHRIYVRDARGREVAPTPLGAREIKAFSPGGQRVTNVTVTLVPGQEDETIQLDLRKYFVMERPGLYSVQVLYEDCNQGPRGKTMWQGQCWSNTVLFEVE
jgi:hypothetical protein